MPRSLWKGPFCDRGVTKLWERTAMSMYTYVIFYDYIEVLIKPCIILTHVIYNIELTSYL